MDAAGHVAGLRRGKEGGQRAGVLDRDAPPGRGAFDRVGEERVEAGDAAGRARADRAGRSPRPWRSSRSVHRAGKACARPQANRAVVRAPAASAFCPCEGNTASPFPTRPRCRSWARLASRPQASAGGGYVTGNCAITVATDTDQTAFVLRTASRVSDVPWRSRTLNGWKSSSTIGVFTSMVSASARERPLSSAQVRAPNAAASSRSAASAAVSDPSRAMAMPASARFSAGASSTPSPLMATESPFACRERTSRSLCSGPLRGICRRRRARETAARRLARSAPRWRPPCRPDRR